MVNNDGPSKAICVLFTSVLARGCFSLPSLNITISLWYPSANRWNNMNHRARLKTSISTIDKKISPSKCGFDVGLSGPCLVTSFIQQVNILGKLFAFWEDTFVGQNRYTDKTRDTSYVGRSRSRASNLTTFCKIWGQLYFPDTYELSRNKRKWYFSIYNLTQSATIHIPIVKG